MKTIERLKQLLALASHGKWYERGINIHIDTTNDGKPYEGFIGAIAYDGHRDLVIESRNALPALLAVVEAQAAEIAKWRAAAETMSDRRSAEDHAHRDEGKWDWTGETCTECSAWMAADDSRKDTDAALRALEGGE